MTLTGVSEVLNFDEQEIVVVTELGQLTIKGRSLHIKNYNTQAGDLHVTGIIDSLVYADKNKNTRSRWDRIREALGPRQNRLC